MFKKFVIIVVAFVSFTQLSTAQSLQNLKAINEVWADFYNAFDSLDIKFMENIHSKDLIRIPGGNRILDYDTYMSNYVSQFKNDKATNQTSEISLRFSERINTTTQASERGIYKMIRNKNTENERIYYGKFHVLFKKIDDEWKIIMDYDSSEANTIGEADYNKAFAIDNFDEFVKH